MKQADKSEITTPVGDGAPPEGGLVWGEVVVAVVFRLYPPTPVTYQADISSVYETLVHTLYEANTG